jgi:lipopolysaccharide export system protein LptC
MFTSENMPYILLALAAACALYYFFVYKKRAQEYKEPSAPEKADPATEMYEEEPYEEEAYVDEEPGAELDKKSK